MKITLLKQSRLKACMASSLSTLAAVTAFSLLPLSQAEIFHQTLQAQESEERSGPRPPPSTRQASTLTRPVFTRIERVVELRDAEQPQEARRVLGELREMHQNGRLNNYETYMMWIFYASIAMDLEEYAESIGFWENALQVPDLSAEQQAQAILTLAQLNFMLERYERSIEEFHNYLALAEDPNNDVYLRIGMAHYVLEDYNAAIPFILQNMDLERAAGNEIPESTFSLLRSLYFNVEDYAKAKQVLKEMIVLFDQAGEWTQLAAVEAQMDNFAEQAYTFYIANLKNYLDSESQLMTLGYLVYNNDNPWGAARLIAKGMEDGIIEENSDNLAFLSLSYQIAREDALAAPPLERAANMSNDGDLWYRLGRIYMNMSEYAKATEAMDKALATGDVERPDQLNLTKANAYMQLNRYDDAIAAAEAAARDQRSRDAAQSWVTVLNNEKRRYETLQRQREELKEFFR